MRSNIRNRTQTLAKRAEALIVFRPSYSQPRTGPTTSKSIYGPISYPARPQASLLSKFSFAIRLGSVDLSVALSLCS